MVDYQYLINGTCDQDNLSQALRFKLKLIESETIYHTKGEHLQSTPNILRNCVVLLFFQSDILKTMPEMSNPHTR